MNEDLLQEKEQRERDELLDAAVFELNQAINLTVAEVSEEKANALIDMLRVQFMDIVRELEALRVSREESEIALQSERVRQWLHSLNRSPFVPLSFRIRHLRAIEGYLDLIAQDMGTLLIRAYKVGVLHIKDKARHNPRLYQDMVHVIGIAVDLARKNLLRGFALYLAPSVLDVRQTFDMARLGLVIARTLDPQQAAEDIALLKQAMIQHELLRRMDMFSLTVHEQRIVGARLADFAACGDIEFLRAGEGPARIGQGPYLVSRMDMPHSKPRRSGSLSDIVPAPVFLIHAAGIFRKAAEAVEHTSATFQLTIDVPELHLENEMASDSLCGSMLLRTFQAMERSARQSMNEVQLHLPVRVALTSPSEPLASEDDGFHDWQVLNLSRNGVMLESDHAPLPVSTLVEIALASAPRYGLVRWCRSSLQGGVRCGIELISSDVLPARVTLIHFSHSDMQDKSWDALLEKVASGWNLWVGGWQGIPVPMTVSIKRENKARTICRVMPTGEVGANYAIFHITEVMHDREALSGQEKEVPSVSPLLSPDALRARGGVR